MRAARTEGEAAIKLRLAESATSNLDAELECETAVRDGGVRAALLNRDLKDTVDEDVDGDEAKVSTRNADWMLEEIDGEWRITAPLPFRDGPG